MLESELEDSAARSVAAPTVGENDETLLVGMAVQAYVGGHLCGQGETLAYGAEIVYVVNVSARGPGGAAGCGTAIRRADVGHWAKLS